MTAATGALATAGPAPRARRAPALALALALTLQVAGAHAAPDDGWSAAERTLLSTLHIDRLPAAPADPSNAVERLPAAAALGKRLFFDTRLSGNQKVACATCHIPERQFQDGRQLGQGVGTGIRRTMPIADSHGHPWFFWDGRKDSLWSQALGPLEDPNEHGGNRTAYAKLVRQYYRADYEALFRALPSFDGAPDNAGPNGTPAERAAWETLNETERVALTRVFANIGKAIAAYEATLHHGPARLDRYVAATLGGAPEAATLLNASEKRGLRLFIGKAQCITCHAGPLLTDDSFHNTGVAPHDAQQPETGRSAAVARLMQDPFNCLGRYSDAAPGDCAELRFIARDDPLMVGAFKTPSLRNVAQRAPYMHAGQVATLADVVRHYAAAPRAAVGKSERHPFALSEQDIADLAGFLGTLSGPIEQSPPQ
jgi:cytochrome c peroxidase